MYLLMRQRNESVGRARQECTRMRAVRATPVLHAFAPRYGIFLAVVKTGASLGVLKLELM